jgi:hypothetical protein
MPGTNHDDIRWNPGHIDLKTDVPHTARIYDYMLGGKDNFAVDRAAAKEIVEHLPSLRASMLANRRFLARIARYMAGELGLRQFLDVGTGLPTHPNLHEVVQEVDPVCRIVYVDNDPIVLVHARALLTSTPEGRTAYVDADLRDPHSILTAPELRDILDLTRPLGVSLIAILQFVEDADETRRIVRELMEPLVAGSALALSIVAADGSTQAQIEQGVKAYGRRGMPSRSWSRPELEELIAEYEVVDPGIALVHQWHPDEAERRVTDGQVYMYGLLAIKR